MATRCDDLTILMYFLNVQTQQLLNAAASAKVTVDAIIADPDYATDLTADEKSYMTTLQTNLVAAPTDFAALTYTLTVSAGTHGSIDPAGSVVVNYGEGKLFTATPDSLYEVDKWTVDSVDVQTGGNTYLIGTVYADATVAVSFKLS